MIRSLTLAASIALVGCGSKETTAPDIETATFAPALGVNLAASTKLPSGVYIRDITVGTGATVANGQTLTMRYVGSLANGTQFDANSTGYPFQLGAGRVIEGWDLGIQGMKVGGQRQLIIPPALAYGAAGRGSIPGNAILVFTVDVVSAQ